MDEKSKHRDLMEESFGLPVKPDRQWTEDFFERRPLGDGIRKITPADTTDSTNG